MLVINDSWLIALGRTHIFARIAAFAMGFAPVRRLAFRIISQTGIHYRESALSQSSGLPEDAPRAGDRFPWLHLRFEAGGAVEDSFLKLSDLRFHLLAFGQAAPDMPGIESHTVPADPGNDAELARAGIPATSFYLLRPDGHVGLCGARFDIGVLEKYFSERLGVERGGIRRGDA